MLNKKVLINIFKKLLEEAKKSYDDFNATDGKIGDGDLGVTILHGLKEINNNENDISLEELYNLSSKFQNENYNVIEVIVE